MSRRLWFLERRKPSIRNFYPVVSGASVDDDDDNEDEDSEDDDDSSQDDKPKALSNLTPEQQREVDEKIGEARRKEREKAQEEFQGKAEEERLKGENKYKELYEKANTALTAMKPKYEALTEDHEALEAAVSKLVEPMLVKLPKLTRTLIVQHPVRKQLELLAEHQEELEGDEEEDTTKPARVPKSNTGKREKKEQPLGKSFTTGNQKRIAERLKARTGSTP